MKIIIFPVVLMKLAFHAKEIEKSNPRKFAESTGILISVFKKTMTLLLIMFETFL